jgi:steroid delta-isomerase-like uncharacterized protein
MSAEDHKALVRRYLTEGWSQGNIGVLDEILAPNYQLRVLQGTSKGEDQVTHGIDRVKQSVAMYHQAFSDLEITPQTIVAEGDRVVVEWTARATHSGAFRHIPPTGKRLSYAGINIYRVEGGKIAEEVYLGDRLGLWQQLGLVPESRKLAAEIGRG